MGAGAALDLHAAIAEAEAALPPPGPGRDHIERAIALARFEVHRSRDEPAFFAELSRAAPEPPVGPLLPGASPELERLMQALVWAADCAEFTDANRDAAQYLVAAEHVRAAVALSRTATPG